MECEELLFLYGSGPTKQEQKAAEGPSRHTDTHMHMA